MGKSAKKAVSTVKKTASNPMALANPLTLGTAMAGSSLLGGQGDQPYSINYAGMPGAPKFEAMGAEKLTSPEVLGEEGRAAIKTRALSQGPSAWSNMMTDRQKAQELINTGRVGAGAQGSLAQSLSTLARQGGGIQGGASGALAGQAMRDAMRGRQKVLSEGAAQRADIGLEDERTKLSLIQGLTSQDLQTRIANAQALANEAARKSSFDLGRYNADMGAWAAEQQGNAMLASSKQNASLLGSLLKPAQSLTGNLLGGVM
jgi:hypothetical protein